MKKLVLTIITIALLAFIKADSSFAQDRESGQSATLAQFVATQQADDRVVVLKKYLQSYDSPLAEYADQFVAWADYYRMPWELLPAISGVESTFGKEVPCTNAFGWNIYGDHMYCFSSYPEAIKTITKTLREQYVNQWGANDVYAIGHYYASSTTWAPHVMYFINDLRSYRIAYQNSNRALAISL